MSADPAGVRAVYDRNAVAFDARRRGSRMETGWISRFAGLLPDGAEVLDLGCGSGEPVARLLLDGGFRVTGADFSRAMLGIARQTFPCAEWIEADMRDLALGRTFDGIVAWHSIFHLTVEEQRAALPKIAAHLRPGVVLMMTLGLTEGETDGQVGQDRVYHASLDAADYRRILAGQGVPVTDFVVDDPETGGANILMARRP